MGYTQTLKAEKPHPADLRADSEVIGRRKALDSSNTTKKRKLSNGLAEVSSALGGDYYASELTVKSTAEGASAAAVTALLSALWK